MSIEVKIALAYSILESLWMKGLLSNEELKNVKDRITEAFPSKKI